MTARPDLATTRRFLQKGAMQPDPDQIEVTISRLGGRVIARTGGPLDRADRAPTSVQGHRYAHLTTPLRQRGLECTVEYGLSDYIVCAQLPDHSTLVISPPQEAPADHPPSWLVTRSHPYCTAVHDVVYNSEPGGPHAQHQGDVAPLLEAIDLLLDQLGVDPRGPMATFARFNAADAVLHRAGFIAEVFYRGRLHYLPAAMRDPAEQRQAVTHAFDALQAEGITVSCDPALLDSSVPVHRDHRVHLGDQLDDLVRSIAHSDHTSQAVGALSELTAPDDGVLDRIVEVLDATAGWWESLGDATDPLYADRLRRIAGTLTVSFLEIRTLRDTLADRHTAHPLRTHPGAVESAEPHAGPVLTSMPKAPSPVLTASPTRPRARS